MWRLDWNSAPFYLTAGSRNRTSSSPELDPLFELTTVAYNDHVSRCTQKKNSSPRTNATSCFDFKSGRQDLNLRPLHPQAVGNPVRKAEQPTFYRVDCVLATHSVALNCTVYHFVLVQIGTLRTHAGKAGGHSDYHEQVEHNCKVPRIRPTSFHS